MSKSPVCDLDQHIGKRLRKLRQHYKISAEKLADAMDTSQQQISRYENGKNKISATQLYRLAQFLNVPVTWFFLDYSQKTTLPILREAAATYQAGQIQDELEIFQHSWPQLSPKERQVVLNLLDTLLLEKRS